MLQSKHLGPFSKSVTTKLGARHFGQRDAILLIKSSVAFSIALIRVGFLRAHIGFDKDSFSERPGEYFADFINKYLFSMNVLVNPGTPILAFSYNYAVLRKTCLARKIQCFFCGYHILSVNICL